MEVFYPYFFFRYDLPKRKSPRPPRKNGEAEPEVVCRTLHVHQLEERELLVKEYPAQLPDVVVRQRRDLHRELPWEREQRHLVVRVQRQKVAQDCHVVPFQW